MITKKLKELMRDCMRSTERATPDSTRRIKFDNDEDNNLLGTKSVPSVSTPKRVGGGKFFIFMLASSFWNARLFFITDSRCFRLQAMTVPL